MPTAPGAQGEALITFESALGVERSVVVQVVQGHAVARLHAIDAAGELQRRCRVRPRRSDSNGTPRRLTLSAPGRPHSAQLALGKCKISRRAQAAKISFDGGPPSRDVRRAYQPRSAVGKRALSIGADAACDRREHDAEQRARIHDVASLGALDGRSRASARLRRDVRSRRRSSRSRKPKPKPSRGTSRARRKVRVAVELPSAAAGTIFRCSESPTTEASAPAPRRSSSMSGRR